MDKSSQHIQKTLEDKLREEWKEYSVSFRYVFGNEDTPDWWLSKFSQALTEQHEADVLSFKEKVEGMKYLEVAVNPERLQWKIMRNKVLDDLLASLDETI